jgi:hypothetical protein
MRTGVSYMGHHNPQHLKTDLEEMKALQLDDVLVAAQENDFAHFVGKIEFTPKMAKDMGIRPIAIFWGVLKVFGGGQSSQFLLEHPEGFQKAKDGSHIAKGCYVNPLCVGRVKEMIDTIATNGFEGYFVDEPAPLRNCFCKACTEKFGETQGGDLATADEEKIKLFREECVLDYVKDISAYCKANHPQLETQCCLMPSERELWPIAAQIEGLDNLGTDIYWVNKDTEVEEATPIIRELGAVCKKEGKLHHQWLQCWIAKDGKEPRIFDQGNILVREKPDALYIWAWKAQIGTRESCVNPELAWSQAEKILRMAKE